MNADGSVMPMKGPAFDDTLKEEFGDEKPGEWVNSERVIDRAV